MSSIHMAVRHNHHSAQQLKGHSKSVLLSVLLRLQAVLDHPYAYLILHAIVGLTIGASTILLFLSIISRFWIIRSILTLVLNLLMYKIISLYYQRSQKHSLPIFRNGLYIVLAAALAWLPVLITT